MRVFTNTKFTGMWPVGTSAVVVADDVTQAASLLCDELSHMGMKQEVFENDFIEVPTDKPYVAVLQDGDY